MLFRSIRQIKDNDTNRITSLPWCPFGPGSPGGPICPYRQNIKMVTDDFVKRVMKTSILLSIISYAPY